MRCLVQGSLDKAIDATSYAPLVLQGLDRTILGFPFVEDFEVRLMNPDVLVRVKHSYPVSIFDELYARLSAHLRKENGARLTLQLEEVSPGSNRRALVAQLEKAREEAYRIGLRWLREGRLSQEQWLAMGLAR